MIEPSALRSVEAKEDCAHLNKQTAKLRRMIEEMEFMQHKSQKRSTQFDDLAKRVFEQQVRLNVSEAYIENELSGLRQIEELFSSKINIIESEKKSISPKMVQFQTELEMFKDALENF